MVWLLSGCLLFLFVRNRFDARGVGRDLQKAARTARRIARDLARTVRQAVRDAKKENGARKGAAETVRAAGMEAPAAAAAPAEPAAEELPAEPVMSARTAAMLVNVPAIEFPKGDPKYDSARKWEAAGRAFSGS